MRRLREKLLRALSLPVPTEPGVSDDDYCERCGHPLPEDSYGWCDDCDEGEKQARWEQEACVCWAGEFSGRSVCGAPCPVHKENP